MYPDLPCRRALALNVAQASRQHAQTPSEPPRGFVELFHFAVPPWSPQASLHS